MFYLQRNLPAWERLLRLAAGLLLGAASVWAMPDGVLRWAALAAALTLAGTALVGFCPACALIGRSPLKERA
jgi:hypothetical protein